MTWMTSELRTNQFLQRILRNNFGVAKPRSTGFNSGLSSGHDVTLIRSRTNNFSIFISFSFGTSVHLKSFDSSSSSWIADTFQSISFTIWIQTMMGFAFSWFIQCGFVLGRRFAYRRLGTVFLRHLENRIIFCKIYF